MVVKYPKAQICLQYTELFFKKCYTIIIQKDVQKKKITVVFYLSQVETKHSPCSPLCEDDELSLVQQAC